MNEDIKKLKAFNIYFEVMMKGKKKKEAIKAVADSQGVSPRTVARWKKELNWDTKKEDRIQKMILEEHKAIAAISAKNWREVHDYMFNLISKAKENGIGEIKTNKEFLNVIKTLKMLDNDNFTRLEAYNSRDRRAELELRRKAETDAILIKLKDLNPNELTSFVKSLKNDTEDDSI